MYDIIIIGAGPAGLTAALYALRSNKKVLVFEAKAYGGQILNASKIENYPGIELISGFDYATNLYNQVNKFGCEIKYETVERVTENKEVITNKGSYHAKAVIIATGSENKKLRIENELEYVGKGISYCATCDGNFYKDKVVAVVGGGNAALEDAIYLSDIAKKVYLIHRRDEFKGFEKYIEEIKEKSNVELVLNSTVTRIIGEEVLKQIEVTDNNLNKNIIDIDGLFIAVGREPKNEIFKNVADLNSNGYIIAKDNVHTNIEGIYVAGDAREKELRQLTTAVSDGSVAATIAIREMK